MNNLYLEEQLASMRLQDYLVKGEEERKAQQSVFHKDRVTRKGFNLQRVQVSLKKLGLF